MEERERLECIERQVCEAEALLAIYEGDETLRVEFSGLDGAREALEAGSPTTELEEISMVLTFAGARDHGGGSLPSVRFSLPMSYPLNACPRVDLGSRALNGKKDRVLEALRSEAGNEALFPIVQLLNELVEEEAARAEPEEGRIEELVSTSPDVREAEGSEGDPGAPDTSRKIKILHSAPLTERKSTFQAHLAEVHSVEEIEKVMSELLSIKKVAASTHNMMAYRIQLENGGVLQDYDDDGEAAAGSRMLHMLQAVNALNVLVVVSRWYGGVQLGPSRFAIINNVARRHLQDAGFLEEKGGVCKSKSSRKTKR